MEGPSISIHPEDQVVQISCSGKTHNTLPYSRVSSLLPLSLDVHPLQERIAIKQSVRNLSGATCNMHLKKIPNIVDSNTNYLFEEKYNPYGPEYLYGGSCVRVVGNFVLFAGNVGDLNVAQLINDQKRVFNRIPGDKGQIFSSKFKKSRIYNIHVNNREFNENLLIATRYQYGVAVYCAKTNEDVDVQIQQVQQLPVSCELASTTFVPDEMIVCLDNSGQLSTWDICTGYNTDRKRLECLLENEIHENVEEKDFSFKEEKLEWRWGSVSKGFHPRSILVGSRDQLLTTDLRSWRTHQINLQLNSWEHVRAIDSEEKIVPYVYTLTDSRLILSDLRQTRHPVMSIDHGRGDISSMLGMGRLRTDGKDWIGIQSRCGDQALCVLDWKDSQCVSLNSDHARFVCSGRRPAVLGGCRGIGKWQETIEKGRDMGEEWLDSYIEERCAVDFTGIDLAIEDNGDVGIYTVNAVGDLFAKTVEPIRENDSGEFSSILEPELVETRESTWLEHWGQSVAQQSFLSKPVFGSVMDRVIVEAKDNLDILNTRRGKKKASIEAKKKDSIFSEGKDTRRIKRFHMISLIHSAKRKIPRRCNSFWLNKLKASNLLDAIDLKIENDLYSKVNGSIKQKYKGLPVLMSGSWPEDVYEWDYLTNEKYSKSYSKLKKNRVKDVKRLKMDVLKRKLDEKNCLDFVRRDGDCHTTAHKLQLSNQKFDGIRKSSRTEKYFAPILKRRIERGEDVNLNKELIPLFERLNLNLYTSRSSRCFNRHSDNILKIMTGDLTDQVESENTFNESLNYSSQPSPAPPTEEDSTYTMDAFWADLGVEMPTPERRRSRSFVSSDDEKDRRPDGDEFLVQK